MPPFDATRGSTRPGPTNWSRKVTGSLVPRLSKLPSVSGYHLIEAGNGVVSSIGLSDTSAQADESTRVASTWVREEKLETPLPKRRRHAERRNSAELYRPR